MYITGQLQFNRQVIHINFFFSFSWLLASLGLGKTPPSFHVVTKSTETGKETAIPFLRDDVVRAYTCAGTHRVVLGMYVSVLSRFCRGSLRAVFNRVS